MEGPKFLQWVSAHSQEDKERFLDRLAERLEEQEADLWINQSTVDNWDQDEFVMYQATVSDFTPTSVAVWGSITTGGAGCFSVTFDSTTCKPISMSITESYPRRSDEDLRAGVMSFTFFGAGCEYKPKELDLSGL